MNKPIEYKEVPCYSADKFKWSNKHGSTTQSELGNWPLRFFCQSPRTKSLKYFTLDTQDPAYEDQWDGEFRRYADNDRKLFITISSE